MKYLICMISLMLSAVPPLIFDFDKKANLQNWRIVNDTVMGGVSSSTFSLNEDGHGVFQGEVSLENNGGFASVQYRFEQLSVKGYTKVKIRLKGDGKKYQFRVKHKASDYYSYITYFTTSGDWEEVEIPLGEMYPSFRGRTLDRPNFSADSIEELAILIGNKKPQDFKLLMDSIELVK